MTLGTHPGGKVGCTAWEERKTPDPKVKRAKARATGFMLEKKPVGLQERRGA